MGECGLKQNASVRSTLLLCFSLVPAVFVLAGVVALWFYPKAARNEASHEAVLHAIAKLKRGQRVADPWREGNYIYPAEPPTRNAGLLSYFLPHELKDVIGRSNLGAPAEPADVSRLWRGPLLWALLGVALLPARVAVVVAGLEGLADDLGASVSPLGLMLVGIGIVVVWFHGLRVWVAMRLRSSGVEVQEVVARLNAVAPFVGAARIECRAE
mmetsp:Transcript_46932/g.135203  ORF Transcript_46932/g.135203 Transcript_46932/m.135203 type:complete len:213 (+) Transcript_46932:1-639(+)